MTIHGDSPSAEASVGAPPSGPVIAGRWSAERTGASTPTLAVVAPIAKPSSTTHAPIAPSPVRYHVLPEQPPDRIMPTPKARPPTTLASQWNGRSGMSTSPVAISAWTPIIATSSASTYARRIVPSPMSIALDTARVRQNPPRCSTYPKARPVSAADV